MMAPSVYRDARLRAAHHVQAKIIRRRDGVLDVEIARVFKGALQAGDRLTLHVSVAGDGPLPIGGTIYTDAETFARASFVEAFLDGDPPEIVRDQVKFIPKPTAKPVGDPKAESALW
jgi:hypothetical protein